MLEFGPSFGPHRELTMSELDDLLAALSRAVLEGEEPLTVDLVDQAICRGIPPLHVIEGGLAPGIRRAGELWETGEYFLPELVTAAQAMKAGMGVVQPALGQGSELHTRGRVVIGTVLGDIHDIGKTLVATMLAANGFEVTDEGVGVSAERFISRAMELNADLICASALLTTTMVQQRELVRVVREAGLRAKVMVGGAPVSAAWAAEIGADGQADNAVSAVAMARRMVGEDDT